MTKRNTLLTRLLRVLLEKNGLVLRQYGLQIACPRPAGQLYGSVSPATSPMLHQPRRALPVNVSLHPEVTVNVARTADEAAAQARGDVLTGPASDRAEVRATAEALFEEAEAERVADEAQG